jgi:hypothetical protein
MAREAREGNEGFLTPIPPAVLAPVAAGELTRIEFQSKTHTARSVLECGDMSPL